MSAELDAALAALDRITPRYGAAKRRLDGLREPAGQAVIRALRAGGKFGEVVRRSPFTDSYVRELARGAGIEGDQRYNRTASRENVA